MESRNLLSEPVWKRAIIGLLIVQAVLLVSGFCMVQLTNLREIWIRFALNSVLDVLGIAVTFILCLSIVRSMRQDKGCRYFLILMCCTSVYLWTDLAANLVDDQPSLRAINYLVNTVYYLDSIAMAWVFWFFVCDLQNHRPSAYPIANTIMWVSAALGTVLVLGNLWGHYYFLVDDNGLYWRVDTYPVSLAAPSVMVILTVIHLLRQRMRLVDKIILLTHPLIPYIGSLLTSGNDIGSLMQIAVFLSMVMIYSNLYVWQERDLMQTQLNAMLLQINPHFLCNILASVASLCRTDPAAASDLTRKFSDFLRDNYVDMSSTPMIPFNEEVLHLTHYLNIEQIRFPNLKVVYDLQATEFAVPSLSVQPLVENAVRHGIRRRRHSAGTVTIASRETPRYFVVRITDDGVGFAAMPEGDGKRHIGIENTRARLRLLCSGTLTVESTPGKGTVSEIIIPKEYMP